MLVGNLGSEYRFSYGVLGDNVNLGSRLEGLNKQYETEILVGENTVELLGDAFRLREVDLVRVVGKTKPTRIFELLAEAGTVLPDAREHALRAYAEALVAYRARRFGDALALLDRALSDSPGDGPARVLRQRCGAYEVAAPPEGWDGVFEATTK
jgi:adenylate cyclase